MPTRFVSLALFLVAGLSAGVARADHFVALQREADSLSQQTDGLFREIRADLAHAPNFGQLIGSSARLRAEAIAFERTVNRPCDPRTLARQLDSLDALVHQVNEAVFDVSRGARYDRFAPACDTRRIQQLARSIENSIHCLEGQVNGLPVGGVNVGRVPYNDPGFGYGPQVQPFNRQGHVSVSPAGVNVGGRGFSVRVGR